MWQALLLSALSGVLLTVGFPIPGMYYVSWVALIPLFVALWNKSSKQALALGYVCGLVHFVTTCYWVRHVLYHYGGLSGVAAVLVLLLMCGYLAVYPAVFALVARKWEKDPLLWAFGIPGLWVTLEWIRAHAVTGFPWASLGYSQTPLNTLIQIADITGVYGVGWLVVLGNTALMACFRRSRGWAAVVAVFIACIGGATLYGAQRIETIRHLEEQSAPWTVAVLQGNIDQSLKWDKTFQQETLQRYKDLAQASVEHVPRPNLLVWPETAIPFFYGVDEDLTAQVDNMVREIGVPELFGSPAVTFVDGKPRLQNRAYLVDERAKMVGSYAKQHLVPFGEYVPFQKLLFFVHRLVEAAGDFMPGRNQPLLVLDGHKIGALICYEGIFPELARSEARQGATCLVNITNDAWYGRTGAPYQHMEMARWRSVEFRMPLIRAANTGISTIVDATGALCGTIPLGEQGQLTCTVRPMRTVTVYERWGDFVAWICVLTTLGGVLYSARKQ
jgi:apolipoprotein N-acyltransferase